MTGVFHLGSILFAAIFVWSGIGKLIDIPGTAQAIAAKVPIPAMLAGLTTQAETALGMPTPQLLAIAAGAVEVLFALLIILNLGVRVAAIVLLLYTIGTIVFFHDFWTMTGADRLTNMIQAFKNLSLIGGFLMLFALGTSRPRMPTA